MISTNLPQSSDEQVLACTISEFSPEDRQRHQQVIDELRAARKSVRELTDGVAFEYPSDPRTLMNIAEFMSREHLCCSFFRLTLEIKPGQASAWLHITGGTQVKEFLHAETNLV